jgi:hypothetical protein
MSAEISMVDVVDHEVVERLVLLGVTVTCVVEGG